MNLKFSKKEKKDNNFSKSLLVKGNNSGLKINSIKNGKIDNYSNILLNVNSLIFSFISKIIFFNF